jgi:hypothetical protein
VTEKQPIHAALPIALGLSALILFISAGISLLLDSFHKSVDAGPQNLIYHTNPAAVLQACGAVLANPQAAGFPSATNGIASIQGPQTGVNPPASLPAALRNLNFEFMTIQGNQLMIYFGGGFGHWGFSTAPLPGGAQLQLIPGLWFWSEFGLPPNPAKVKYYRTGEWLIGGGIIVTIAAITVQIYRRRISALVERQNARFCVPNVSV